MITKRLVYAGRQTTTRKTISGNNNKSHFCRVEIFTVANEGWSQGVELFYSQLVNLILLVSIPRNWFNEKIL